MKFRPGGKFEFDIGPMPTFVKPHHRTQILGADHFMVGRWCMGSNPEGHSHPGLNHHLIAVCLAERGARFELETDRRYTGQLRFGDMSVLPAHVPSRNRWSGPSNTLSLHLPVTLWEEVADAHRIQPGLLHPGLPGSDAAISRLSVMLAEELERPYRNLMYCESLALGAFAKMAERIGGHAITRCDALADWRLRRVAEYIEANLEGSLNIADLARVADLSRSHFMQAFRDAFKQTPHQYVLIRRIESAKRRLRMDRESVTDIANSLGFSSHAHFSGVFRRLTGVSPTLYRLGEDSD
ncbi:AraC family transcriptional regulator [Uliginosibacterium sp. 31-16]|uniref:AraC family transcriptional regulator n=1 Tax=Uliginosibacterium sp. 31-16 TaxID=3068315 RepID=UPI00273F2E90|nr:AraC family transcriptional regulator [Uliginosibacterium sp. 31-16]MDP5238714.1 AraC family transcriptional regulator [Uliginosibacterium sp. 31-16]